MFNLLRGIYWNLHLLLAPYIADSDLTKNIGSSSLFASCTLFWMLSIYHFIARFIIEGRPIDASGIVGLIFVLSTVLSIYIATTTKIKKEDGYVSISFLNKSLSRLLSLGYMIGSFFVFFRYVL